jgi:phosphomevalonate kinase
VLDTDASGNLQVSKTGMGSSAALTTSFVGALLQWFGIVTLSAEGTRLDEDKRVIHNVSQLAHAVAQGKIGSGFDVAAAVYGKMLCIVEFSLNHIEVTGYFPPSPIP